MKEKLKKINKVLDLFIILEIWVIMAFCILVGLYNQNLGLNILAGLLIGVALAEFYIEKIVKRVPFLKKIWERRHD